MDWCICFTQKIQHGSDWERSRPKGPKNVHTFLMTVRPLNSNVPGSKIINFRPDYPTGSLIYDRPKKCPTILYAVNLWLKPVSATGASHNAHCFVINKCGPLTIWIRQIYCCKCYTYHILWKKISGEPLMSRYFSKHKWWGPLERRYHGMLTSLRQGLISNTTRL